MSTVDRIDVAEVSARTTPIAPAPSAEPGSPASTVPAPLRSSWAAKRATVAARSPAPSPVACAPVSTTASCAGFTPPLALRNPPSVRPPSAAASSSPDDCGFAVLLSSSSTEPSSAPASVPESPAVGKREPAGCSRVTMSRSWSALPGSENAAVSWTSPVTDAPD